MRKASSGIAVDFVAITNSAMSPEEFIMQISLPFAEAASGRLWILLCGRNSRHSSSVVPGLSYMGMNTLVSLFSSQPTDSQLKRMSPVRPSSFLRGSARFSECFASTVTRGYGSACGSRGEGDVLGAVRSSATLPAAEKPPDSGVAF